MNFSVRAAQLPSIFLSAQSDEPSLGVVTVCLDASARTLVRIQPGDVLAVPLPVREISVRLIRKKAERVAKLHWNPKLGALESPWYEACSGPAHPLLLCDDRVHFLCKSCAAPCRAPAANISAGDASPDASAAARKLATSAQVVAPNPRKQSESAPACQVIHERKPRICPNVQVGATHGPRVASNLT